MPKTGSHLRVSQMGDNVLGVELLGDPRKPEPESFRVHFPGGVVDIERCSDNSYWVHVICDLKEKVIDCEGPGTRETYSRFSEARMHMTHKHSAEADLGDFENPSLYDVALHIVKA